MINTKTARRNERLIAYHQKHPGMSYAALGRVFKLTRERVRQILSPEGSKGAQSQKAAEPAIEMLRR